MDHSEPSPSNRPMRRTLRFEPYEEAMRHAPSAGRHISAQFDDDTVVVYQMFKPSIGQFAARENRFVGAPGYLLGRMTWIKTGFLWAVYRSGWGTKRDQEVTLAIWVKRAAFDEILASAVAKRSIAKHCPGGMSEWKEHAVRLQWDPDHKPSGEAIRARRAIQLGIRKHLAARFASGESIAWIEDISEFVAQQRVHALSGDWSRLMVPVEREYAVTALIADRLGMHATDDDENDGGDEDGGGDVHTDTDGGDRGEAAVAQPTKRAQKRAQQGARKTEQSQPVRAVTATAAAAAATTAITASSSEPDAAASNCSARASSVQEDRHER